MKEFKFFKGQSKEPVFLSNERDRLGLSDRWMWIYEPSVVISDFDYDTGALFNITHNTRNFYCTFSEFIGDIMMGSRLFYIFNITMYVNGEAIRIPQGTSFSGMGIYDWSNDFRIIAVVI
jgi:hypothetical protein